MSEKPEEDSKTEAATEKRIQDAFDKGNTPNSREVTILASTLGLCFAIIFLSVDTARSLAWSLSTFMSSAHRFVLEQESEAHWHFVKLTATVGTYLAPVLGVLLIFGLAGSLFQNVPAMKLDRITPKASRISLKEGLKRMLGRQGAVEFGKTVFKFATVATGVAVVVKADIDHIFLSILGDPNQLPGHIYDMSVRLVVVAVGAMVFLGLADFSWSRYQWLRNLRMTRQELKDEQKQTDGDPQIKVRQLSIARSRQRQRMIETIPTATLIINNPTHYSVALKYEQDEDAAPIVVAKGKDLVALRMRELAEEHNIPMFENKPLAQGLYGGVEVGQIIPLEFYKPVAELISYVNRLR